MDSPTTYDGSRVVYSQVKQMLHNIAQQSCQ